MTEQEERELMEWMQANADEYILSCAQELKEYCNNRECEKCVFYAQIYSVNKECKIALVNPFGGTVPPEDWEV